MRVHPRTNAAPGTWGTGVDGHVRSGWNLPPPPTFWGMETLALRYFVSLSSLLLLLSPSLPPNEFAVVKVSIKYRRVVPARRPFDAWIFLKKSCLFYLSVAPPDLPWNAVGCSYLLWLPMKAQQRMKRRCVT